MYVLVTVFSSSFLLIMIKFSENLFYLNIVCALDNKHLFIRTSESA